MVIFEELLDVGLNCTEEVELNYTAEVELSYTADLNLTTLQRLNLTALQRLVELNCTAGTVLHMNKLIQKIIQQVEQIWQNPTM